MELRDGGGHMAGRRIRVLGVVAVLALMAVGCGGDDDSSSTTTEGDTTTTASGDGGTTLVVSTTETEFGEILVDNDGYALYAFLEDEGQATPTCVDDCAEKWPPVIAENIETRGNLDADFNLVERDSGHSQVTVNGRPVYTMADDEPGEALCQGGDGVWWVVGPDGNLIGAPEGTTDTTTVS
jgi:predicted lipoprotein with Yx(FWY)xxD motif